MGRFRAERSSPAPNVRAAAGTAAAGAFLDFTVGAAVERAMTLPTLARAQNLIASMVSTLDLQQYQLVWDTINEKYQEVNIPGESWMTRPDPSCTRQFVIGNLASDLYWYSRAFLWVSSRYSNGYPASFKWLPAGSISTPGESGPVWYGPAPEIWFGGQQLDPRDIVQFLMPTPGVLWTGLRAIEIAIRLDRAVARSASPAASGYLQQTEGEPMTAEELTALAQGWIAARAGTESAEGTSIGALNQFAKFVELSAPPSLAEHREYSSLDLSRVANVPPYLLGISTGGMTYQNAQEAVRQLWLFGAKPIAACIAETFSLDTVIPRGRHVRFDVDDLFIESAIADAATTLTDMPTTTELPT